MSADSFSALLFYWQVFLSVTFILKGGSLRASYSEAANLGRRR